MVEEISEQLDAVFHALADPTRRAMMRSLAEGERSVGELAEPFAMTFAGASKHVKTLEQAGLVRREVRGRQHFCRLDADQLQSATDWLRYYERFWSDRLDALSALRWAREGGIVHLNPEHGVTIVRQIAASAEELYAAWTEPAIMRTWLAKIVDADVRIGGSYRIENHDGETVNVHRGEYRVLEPGRRIVMTFRHDATEPGTYEDEYVEVTLRPLGPKLTELTLTNGWNGLGMTDGESDALKDGWNQWVTMLDDAIVHGKPSF